MDHASFLECHKAICSECLSLADKKNRAYGNKAWELMLFSSVIDMLLVKVLRIRSLLEMDEKLFESIEDSLLDIINYAVIALIKLRDS